MSGLSFRATAATALILVASCGERSTPAPPPLRLESTDALQITGRERLAWNQIGENLSEYHFAVYVDGNRVELPLSVCSRTGSAASGFECTSPLPSLSVGRHVLELVSWIIVDGVQVESPTAAPIVVVLSELPVSSQVSASSPTAGSYPSASAGQMYPATGCGLSLLSDSEFLMWDQAGNIRVMSRAAGMVRSISWRMAEDDDWMLAGVAPDPDRTGVNWMYLAQLRPVSEGVRVRISRYREVGDILGERIVLLDIALHATPGRTSLAFAPDNRLHFAMLAADDEGGDGPVAEDGRFLIRLDRDGSIPPDNELRSVFSKTRQQRPFALAWDARGATTWVASRSVDRRYVVKDSKSNQGIPLNITAPPIAMRIADAANGSNLFVIARNGDVVRLRSSDDGWTFEAQAQLFPSDKLRDAIRFRDGELVACGHSAGSAAHYEAWRGRAPL